MSKLYVYELVMSIEDYKRHTGRKYVSRKEWLAICESLSDALDRAYDQIIKKG